MQQEERVFYLSPEEAEVIAKADTGTGDLPRKLSFGMVIMFIAVILLRMIFDMPLPSMRTMGFYLVAVLAWIGIVVYSGIKVKQTAEELKGKAFYVKVTDEGIAAGKHQDDLSFHAMWNDIQIVEKGSLIYRITSPMGRLCLPRTALSSWEREKLESLDTILVNSNWM